MSGWVYAAIVADMEKQITKRSADQARSVMTSQNTVEWFTPPHVITWVKDILGGIALDPASCYEANEIVGADDYYSLGSLSDGLVESWQADTIFLNPPFDATSKWVDKMTAEYAAGNFREGILLVNSALGYVWWEKLWRARPVCCLEKRLRFIGPKDGQAKKGQALVYFGPNYGRFADVLRPHGRILLPSVFDARLSA